MSREPRHPACGGPTPRARPAHLCGDAALFERAYPFVARWPYDSFHLVMELGRPGSCNLYESRKTCCQFADGRLPDPERHVREAIAAALIRCRNRPVGRPCLALDLGAKNGWFSAFMLQLGAHVISVEPQPDLARALRDTVALNCWSDRSVVFNAFACADAQQDDCMAETNVSRCILGYRLSYPPNDPLCAEKHGIMGTIRGVALEDLFFRVSPHSRAAVARNEAPRFEFAKLDADGPEGGWLSKIDELITGNRLRVETIQMEGSNLDPRMMQRYQQVHGYTVYRLDWLDGRRKITEKGWDAFSPRGTFAPLSRLAHVHRRIGSSRMKYSPLGFSRMRGMRNHTRDDFEEEMFSIRGMRHVFRVKRNISVDAWTLLLQPIAYRGWPPQWLITLDDSYLEPSWSSIPCDQSPECREVRARVRNASRTVAGREGHLAASALPDDVDPDVLLEFG